MRMRQWPSDELQTDLDMGPQSFFSSSLPVFMHAHRCVRADKRHTPLMQQWTNSLLRNCEHLHMANFKSQKATQPRAIDCVLQFP